MLSVSHLGKLSLTKNLITDQTYTNVTRKLNATNMAFDATEGLGQANATSQLILLHVGGFNDQKITGSLKWVAPSTAADYDIGVIARCLSVDTPNASYYYARAYVTGGVEYARISKVLNGSFSTLATGNFVLPANTPVSIELSCIGTTISATFTAAGVAGSPLTISAVDSDIPEGGLMGMRSLNGAVWFRSFTVEQL